MAPAPKLPDALLSRIIDRLAPEQIWLFGSRARGDATPTSDWDLMVVLPDGVATELLDWGNVWDLCARDLPLPVDVVPVSRSEFAQMRTLAGSLCRTVALDGCQVYGEVVPPNPIALGYLQAASEDVDAARRLLSPPPNRLASYHLQQAAEKLAKAVLSARGIHTTKEHHLSVLAAMLPAGDAWGPRLSALSHLDRFATTFRYPGTSGKLQPGEQVHKAQADLDAIALQLQEATSEVGIGR